MRNKGFTLIELLAIIVILAIIAVIVTPIILEIIEDSKISAVVDSAYGYKDGLEKYYISESINNPDFESLTAIYDISELPYDFSVNGETPDEGWIELEKGRVIRYSLRFGEYVVNYDASNNLLDVVKNGELAQIDSTNNSDDLVVPDPAPEPELIPEPEPQNEAAAIIASLNGTVKNDGAKYLSTPIQIYFNPSSGSNGELCNSGETGCLHWYLYSVKDTYANMILDRNIGTTGSSSGVWATKNDYKAGLTAKSGGGYKIDEGAGSKAISAGISYPGISSFPDYGSSNNARGPITALNTLKSLTDSWKTGMPLVPNSSTTDEYIIPSSENQNKYQINYTGYHARLITSQEAGFLGCSSLRDSCPSWMLNNLGSSNAPCGYWTSNPKANDSERGASIDKYNNLKMLGNYKVNDTDGGIRPVITVPIVSVLSSN